VQQAIYERVKIQKQVEEIAQRRERTQAQIDALQDKQDTTLENEAELRRLKQLKKNYQTDFENKQKKNWLRLENKQKPGKKTRKG